MFHVPNHITGDLLWWEREPKSSSPQYLSIRGRLVSRRLPFLVDKIKCANSQRTDIPADRACHAISRSFSSLLEMVMSIVKARDARVVKSRKYSRGSHLIFHRRYGGDKANTQNRENQSHDNCFGHDCIRMENSAPLVQ